MIRDPYDSIPPLTVQKDYSSRGSVSYVIEVSHPGLKKYRLIRRKYRDEAEKMAYAQLIAWQEQWQAKQEAAARRQEREQTALEKEQKRQLAAERTSEAQAALASISQTLQTGLRRKSVIDWDLLKDRSEFPEPRPERPVAPQLRQEPTASDPEYHGSPSIIDRVLKRRWERKVAQATVRFQHDHERWEEDQKEAKASHRAAELAFAARAREWIGRKDAFLRQQGEKNAQIDSRREEYLNGARDAVIGYCDAVLAGSPYPDSFTQNWELDYSHQTRMLVVEYSLPPIESLPNTEEVKYVQARDEFQEVPLKEGELNKLYDELLYQMCLRTVHELFSADQANALDGVAFNGWVRSVDKATGQEVNACILSLMTTRGEFEKVNLAQVDPKACFKSLKGVGSSKLHGLAPVKPILQMNREDPRFVASYEVADSLDDSVNIAAMDWLDFEHLIRELFEKEFAQNGGEVKVTQASHDGGVDAVAFDPDPIRGGKIVIQAKRYTNTVGVEAVRDLYGTVINEGATKGILITTADYGPEAYNFAKDKPLTLLNGGNLLHLLQQHGHKAKIDLKEAKVILKEQEKP